MSSSPSCPHANAAQNAATNLDGDANKSFVEAQEDDSCASSKDAKYSCIGRVTWLNGNETELDDEETEGDDFDDDDVGEYDDDTSSDETIVRKETKWGWLVVFSSFVIHMLADGITFSFGVLLHRLIDVFGVSKDKVALVGSLLGGIPLFMGPVCSILINRFGCRAVTVTGGFLTGIGFILSSYVTHFDLFFLTMSLVSGLGLSLVYLPAVVVVAYYFEEHRSLATGKSTCVSGRSMALYFTLFVDFKAWLCRARV
jgi:hypothetical protein